MKYLKDFWRALESGFRAGRKQFRHMRTVQRNRANLITPF